MQRVEKVSIFDARMGGMADGVTSEDFDGNNVQW